MDQRIVDSNKQSKPIFKWFEPGGVRLLRLNAYLFRGMFHGYLVAVLLLFPASNLPAMAQEQAEIAGIVASIDGTWEAVFKNQSKRLRKGSSVLAGWSLRRTSSDGSLRLIKPDGSEITCPKQRRVCACALKARAEHDFAKDIFSSAMRLFEEQPDRWVCATTRSLFSVSDGVVAIDGDGANLRPLIEGPRNQPVFYTLRSTKDASSSSGSVKPDEKDFVVGCGGLAPGLYKLTYGSDARSRGSNAAFVALVAKDEFKSVSSRFADARRLMIKKQSGDTRIKNALLRAYLFDLVNGWRQ